MSVFEDLYEVYTNAGAYDHGITGPCEADTLNDALETLGARMGHDADVTAGDAVVITDRVSAEEISDRLGDRVHVTFDSPHVDAEFVDTVPRRIEQVLPGKTQLHTIDTSARFGLIIVPSCVTYDNTIADPAGVLPIDWVVTHE